LPHRNNGEDGNKGRILAVQPRIRLLRSFDRRQHNYSGYALLIKSGTSPFPDGKPLAHCIGLFLASAAAMRHRVSRPWPAADLA
jgi:hypothetical protein